MNTTTTADASVLFHQHTRLAFHISSSWGRSYPWHAHDFESDALLALWNCATRHDPAKGEFQQYARFVIVKVMGHRLASEKRKNPAAFYNAMPVDNESGEAIDPLALVADQHPPDEHCDVEDLLAVLAPDERALVELRLWDGFHLADIGTVVGVTGATVANRLDRAMEKMRVAAGEV